MPSEAVQLAIIAVVASLCTGTVVVAVGVWADGRRKRADAAVRAQDVTQAARVKSEDKAQEELALGRREDRERITRLEGRLEEKDRQNATLQAEIEQLMDERRELRATVRELQAALADLQRQVDQLKRHTGDSS